MTSRIESTTSTILAEVARTYAKSADMDGIISQVST